MYVSSLCSYKHKHIYTFIQIYMSVYTFIRAHRYVSIFTGVYVGMWIPYPPTQHSEISQSSQSQEGRLYSIVTIKVNGERF